MNKKESVEEATIRSILNCRGVDEETIKGVATICKKLLQGTEIAFMMRLK